LKKCLVTPPIRKTYADSFRKEQTLDLWLVLEEKLGTKSGYQIIFDDQKQMFGLAIWGRESEKEAFHDIFIGYYGTFLETLDGM
jgi:hypothetical protein